MTVYRARAEWGAQTTSLSRWRYTVDTATYHWCGFFVGKYTDEARLMQRLQRDALGEGYSDFEYNFGVGQSGTKYEGRGWQFRSGANGEDANADGVKEDPNGTSLAFVYLAGPGDPLTDAAKQAFRELAAEAKTRFPHLTRHVPHSFWHATACPGDELRSFVTSGAVLRPLETPTPVTEDELDMSPDQLQMYVAATLIDLLEDQDNPTAVKFRQDLRHQVKTAVRDVLREAGLIK